MLKELASHYLVKKANPYRNLDGTFATKDDYAFMVEGGESGEVFNKELKATTPKKIIESIFGSEGEYKDNNISISKSKEGGDHVFIEGYGGKLYGSNLVSLGLKLKGNEKNKELYIDYISLESNSQGGGSVKKFFKNALPEFYKNGVRKVTLTANDDAGGYAWAKYGFNLKDKTHAKKLSVSLNKKIDLLKPENELAKKEVKIVKKMLTAYSNDVALPRIISDIKTPEMDKLLSKKSGAIKPTLSKHLLMNEEWDGELDLTNTNSVNRLRKYVNSVVVNKMELRDLANYYLIQKWNRLNKYINSGSVKKTEIQQVNIKKQDGERQVVWGELYAPNRLDSDNEFMSKETLENLQMTIAKSGFKLPVDLDHKNVSQNDAHIVECFIARKGDPDFIEGSLVVGLHIPNKTLWNEVKGGRYNGFSIEALVNKESREVEIEIPDMINGKTSESMGHSHDFTVNLDVVNGVLVFKGGETTPCKRDGHIHKIMRRSATEITNGHNHKISITDYLKIKD